MPTLAVFLLLIHGALLLGGKNLFEKAVYQFRRTVEGVQIRLHIIPKIMVLGTPAGNFFLGGGKFLFEAAILNVHHIAMCGLLFQGG